MPDFAFVPREGLQVLYPFEITDDHAPGIAQNVRDDQDPFFLQDTICFGRGRPVRSLSDDSGVYPIRVITVDLPFQGCRYQYIDLQFQ